MRLSRPGLFIAKVLLCTAVAAGALYLLHEWREQPYRQLRLRLAEVQLALESFAVNTEGAYPESLELLVQRGYLKGMPDNPFGPGPMPILKAGDQWQAGGIVYVPSGPVIAIGKGEATQWPPIIPTENDMYLLVAYSPREHPQRQKQYEAVRAEYEQSRIAFVKGELPVTIPVYAEGIDWQHVEKMVTAGEGYE